MTLYKQSKGAEIAVDEKWAWVVIRKRNGSIIKEAGISFETKPNECPEEVKIDPIYKDEYENVRVPITISYRIKE